MKQYIEIAIIIALISFLRPNFKAPLIILLLILLYSRPSAFFFRSFGLKAPRIARSFDIIRHCSRLYNHQRLHFSWDHFTCVCFYNLHGYTADCIMNLRWRRCFGFFFFMANNFLRNYKLGRDIIGDQVILNINFQRIHHNYADW